MPVGCTTSLPHIFTSPARRHRYIDVRSTCGFTPLHHAIVCTQVPCVGLLLSLGADPTFRSLYEGLDWIRCSRGSSALHLAARKGHEQMCKLLVRAQVGLWAELPSGYAMDVQSLCLGGSSAHRVSGAGCAAAARGRV
jgi:ankyrin repeat protein